jgi:Pyruvate/2-oxoacid:ferredoxin oxidoreductase delta subunit
MRRAIVKIDEDKCNGCGACVPACAEGAIRIVDGKARLVSDVYCDGLGACLGTCPQGAITIEQREAEPFDAEAAEAFGRAASDPQTPPREAGADARRDEPAFGGCPGLALQRFAPAAKRPAAGDAGAGDDEPPPSRLGQWPVQLRLVPPHAPFLVGADLVICADCVPFAVADFHDRYLDGRAVLVGCPKLDDLEQYRQKLRQIFAHARPARVTVLRMEVPCCAALAAAAVEARNAAAPDLPMEVHTIGIRGGIVRQEVPSPAMEESA